MGMTIDKYLRETNTVLITQDAFEEMKNTMRKYQEIQEIVTKWSSDMRVNTTMAMCEIEEVVEDGKID